MYIHTFLDTTYFKVMMSINLLELCSKASLCKRMSDLLESMLQGSQKRTLICSCSVLWLIEKIFSLTPYKFRAGRYTRGAPENFPPPMKATDAYDQMTCWYIPQIKPLRQLLMLAIGKLIKQLSHHSLSYQMSRKKYPMCPILTIL